MKYEEIKARIASLLSCKFEDIELHLSQKENKISYDDRLNKYIITYASLPGLIHELSHIVYTNFSMAKSNAAIDALEDLRIEKLLSDHEPELFKVILNNYSKLLPRLLTNLKRGGSASSKDIRNDSILLSVAIPEQLLKEVFLKTDLDKATQNEIQNIRNYLTKDPFDTKLRDCLPRLLALLDLPKDDKENVERQMKLGSNKPAIGVNKKEEKSFKDLLRTETLDPIVESRLINGLKKLAKAKELGSRMNTVRGKLNSKKIGKFPSLYLFSKKTKPSPKTALYILADLSGSMEGDKLGVLIPILNVLKKAKITNLSINVFGFNTTLFAANEIGENYWSVMQNNVMGHNPKTGGQFGSYNIDAYFLKEVLGKMAIDRTPNKKLIILSDGEPTNGPGFKETERDLAKVAKTIPYPYVSIGILSNAVKKYYKHTRIIHRTGEFANILKQEAFKLLS